MARKVKNFRDLGGIPAANGKRVCYGKLYRSGHLGKIKPEVAEKLRDRKGLRTVIDLRAPAELSHKRDIVPEGVDYLHIPPLTDEQNPAVTRHTGPSILKKIMKVDGGARTYLSDTYRTMISSEPSLEALREFFRILLEDDGAVLWHCTQGKDRTGVVAAATLLALGVNRDEIMRDYMKTNRSCRFKNFWIFIGVVLVTLSVRKAHNLNLLLSSRRGFMSAAFDEIDRVWNGTEGFLHDALLLSDEDIKELREIYLV
ncbi:MAG: tyrosine-protein phosphatase [Clostridia bacterium]|nr:tyrosine-protein phosphatase [Clostridia bacterium]